MKSHFRNLVALGVLSLSLPPVHAQQGWEANAFRISPVDQMLWADAVVVGRVMEMEPRQQAVTVQDDNAKIWHLVATVRVDECLLGAGGVTHVRVGFVPTPPVLGDARMRRRPRCHLELDPPMLWEGQQGCFFLKRHPTADFYIMMPAGQPLEICHLDYQHQMKMIRAMRDAWEKPLEALQAKEAADRQFAACALISKYRTLRSDGDKPPPKALIPARESTLILEALAEMKWAETPLDRPGGFNLENAFSALQLTEKDGWQHPFVKENEDENRVMGEAALKWLKANASKYRIQRLTEESRGPN